MNNTRPKSILPPAYFTIRGFELLGETLPQARHVRLLLADEPQSGGEIGVRAHSAAYLRHELNAEPLRAARLPTTPGGR